MLFVLTAADISAVGPGVWNEWKAELTTILYERTMLWLSGKSHLFDEATRLKTIKQQVAALITEKTVEKRPGNRPTVELATLAKQLDQFPPHYLLETPPARIADDFRIQRMKSDISQLISQNYKVIILSLEENFNIAEEDSWWMNQLPLSELTKIGSVS